MMLRAAHRVEGVLMASKKASKKSARRSKVTASGAAPARSGKKKKVAARRGSSAAASKKTASKTTASKTAAPKASARKSKKVQPIPAGYGAVTPQLVVSPCADALEFYERAFGAQLGMRMPGPDGLLMHAEMNIGGSIIMLADEMSMPGEVTRKSPRNAGAITGGVMLYVEDVDALFQRALAQGAKSLREPTDEFWGDRFAQLEDPYGHVWSMATHVRDVAPEEMLAAMSQMPSAEG
jgi:PhnB protein